MPYFPSRLFRVTQHEKPWYQLYFPGFSARTSEFIQGRWVRFPKDKWEAKKDAYQAMYADVLREQDDREYSAEKHPIDPIDMTPTQRAAWEFYSGCAIVNDVWHPDGNSFVSVELKAGMASDESLQEIRIRGCKVFRHDKFTGEDLHPENIGIPEDLITNEKCPKPISISEELSAFPLDRLINAAVGFFESFMGPRKD